MVTSSFQGRPTSWTDIGSPAEPTQAADAAAVNESRSRVAT